jgi:hypothetical protein
MEEAVKVSFFNLETVKFTLHFVGYMLDFIGVSQLVMKNQLHKLG